MTQSRNKDAYYMGERIFNFLLALVPGVGDVTIRALLNAFGSAEEIFRANERQLAQVEKVSEKKIKGITAIKAKKEEVIKKVMHWKSSGIKAVFVNEPEYPRQLKNLYDAPFVIFYKGNLPAENAPNVAIIGARACTEYGKNIAYSFGRSLALKGIQIISGMAAGADVYAHKGALSGGGYTAGVLGSGVDICYPRTNFSIYTEMQINGCVMSEVLPGTSPAPGLFPRRNRIIASLSDAVIITEAKEKSGSLITADQALEQGKEVFAVPGRIGDPLSLGCLSLIRQGAYPLTCTEDIINCAGIRRKLKKSTICCVKASEHRTSSLMTDECCINDKKVFETLTDIPKNINRIMYETEIGYEEAAQAIINLELQGLLRSVSAGLYVKAFTEV